jgi:hypothetical protein
MSTEPEPTTKLFFREAIIRALSEEMHRDEGLVLMGQDIGAFGGPYREFDGLHAGFGPGRAACATCRSPKAPWWASAPATRRRAAGRWSASPIWIS